MMNGSSADSRSAVLARLAESREELRAVFEPPPPPADGSAASNAHPDFPRSRTMKLLMSGRGLGTLGALAGGLLMARPGLALRLLRYVPANAVAKMLITRGVAALKSKPHPVD